MFYQRKTMFNKIIWCTCVLLLLVSSDFKGIECRLLLKLQNVAVFDGEIVTLQCTSTETSKGSIGWGISGLPDRYIFSGTLNQDISGYNVSEKDDGSSVLSIAASVTTANRYFCFDGKSHEKWSAELVVLVKSTECGFQVQNDSVTVKCSIEYAGNWAPVVECKQTNGKTVEVLQENKTDTKRDENTATSDIWTFHTKNKLWEIICSTKFKQHDRPKETNETNIPKIFFSDMRVYEPTRDLPDSKSIDRLHESSGALSNDIQSVAVVGKLTFPCVVIVVSCLPIWFLYRLYQRKKQKKSARNNCTYLIKSELNEMVLNVDRSLPRAGTRVFTHPKQGGANQQWYDDLFTGTIRSRLNDFCMDIENGQLVLNPYKPGKCDQQWERRGTMIYGGGTSNMVLDIFDSNKSSEAKVVVQEADGGSNQSWTFELAD